MKTAYAPIMSNEAAAAEQQAQKDHWDGQAERAVPSIAACATARRLDQCSGITRDHGGPSLRQSARRILDFGTLSMR